MKVKVISILLNVILLLVFAKGCWNEHTSRRNNVANLPKVREGMHVRDVLRIMGTPNGVSNSPDSSLVFYYLPKSRLSATILNVRLKMDTVVFVSRGE